MSRIIGCCNKNKIWNFVTDNRITFKDGEKIEFKDNFEKVYFSNKYMIINHGFSEIFYKNNWGTYWIDVLKFNKSNKNLLNPNSYEIFEKIKERLKKIDIEKAFYLFIDKKGIAIEIEITKEKINSNIIEENFYHGGINNNEKIEIEEVLKNNNLNLHKKLKKCVDILKTKYKNDDFKFSKKIMFYSNNNLK